MNSFIVRSKIWLIKNLFSSKLNILLSFFAMSLTIYFAWSLAIFVFISADWKVVDVNLRLLLLGPFPKEAEWRIWVSIFWVSFMTGLTYKNLSTFQTKHLLNISPLILFILFLINPVNNIMITLLLALSIVCLFFGYNLPTIHIFKLNRNTLNIIGWAITLPLIVVFLKIFGGVETTKWGGYFLNIMLAWVGIIFGFIFGLIFATILTLIVTPSALMLRENVVNWYRKKINI